MKSGAPLLFSWVPLGDALRRLRASQSVGTAQELQGACHDDCAARSCRCSSPSLAFYLPLSQPPSPPTKTTNEVSSHPYYPFQTRFAGHRVRDFQRL